MNAFAEELIQNIAQRQQAAGHAARRREERIETAERRIEDVDAAARDLLRDCLRPLAEAFQEALESQNVVEDGVLVEETAPESLAAAQGGGSPGQGRKTGRKKRATTGDFKRFLAERAAAGLPPLAGEPLVQMAAFDRYVAGVRRREAAAVGAGVPAWRRVVYRCRTQCSPDPGGGRKRYEVRVSAAATRRARSSLPASASRAASPTFAATRPKPSSSCRGADDAAPAAARQWCQSVLGQCAAAIMEAEAGVNPALAAPAPAVPLAAYHAMPVDVSALAQV